MLAAGILMCLVLGFCDALYCLVLCQTVINKLHQKEDSPIQPQRPTSGLLLGAASLRQQESEQKWYMHLLETSAPWLEIALMQVTPSPRNRGPTCAPV